MPMAMGHPEERSPVGLCLLGLPYFPVELPLERLGYSFSIFLPGLGAVVVLADVALLVAPHPSSPRF